MPYDPETRIDSHSPAPAPSDPPSKVKLRYLGPSGKLGELVAGGEAAEFSADEAAALEAFAQEHGHGLERVS